MKLTRKANGRKASVRTRRAESRSRRKGEEQREAAEHGKTIRFYAKEVLRKGLNPIHRSAHFEK